MNLDQIRHQTIAVAQEAGAFMQQEAKLFNTSSIEYKGKNDLVSYVDKETEKIIVAGLRQIVPEAGFITEEGTTDVGPADVYNWVIDPVDGTTNYVHGLPVYSSSIALMKKDEVVVGVVNDPARKECFHVIQGGPAYCNDQEIKVSPITTLAHSLLTTGFPYATFDTMSVYMKVLEDLMTRTQGIRRMGSAALDLAYVACGRFEGFFEFGLKPWDVAAGVLLVQQAGGSISTFTGTDDYIFGREMIAGGPVREELRKAVEAIWYKQN